MSPGQSQKRPSGEYSRSRWRRSDSKSARRYWLLRNGAHHALSAIDLLICATAAQHNLTVLHDDNDFAAARYLPDLREHNIHHTPETG